MTGLTHGQRIAKNATPAAEPVAEEPSASSAPLSLSVLSCFVSTIFHTALLLLLALWVYNTGDNVPLETVQARLEDHPEPEAITQAEVVLDNALHSLDDEDSSKVLENAPQLANASSSPPRRDVFLSTTGVMTGLSPQSGHGGGGDELAGLGEAVGFETVAGDGEREPGEGEVGFFGTKAKGKSFVFIVDCSGSMTTPTGAFHPRTGRPVTRFFRVRQELYESLGQLSEKQTFYIIFFNHETYPMFFPRQTKSLVPANKKFVDMARTWVSKAKASGGTDPREAFQLALALQPEVIFFMTDGAIPPVSRKVAKEHNKSRTIIHTIAFGIETHQEILQGIASDNQGRFRFVP